MRNTAIVLLAVLASVPAQAKPPFSSPDFSGTYECYEPEFKGGNHGTESCIQK